MSISNASPRDVNWTDLQSDIVDLVVHCFDDVIDFKNFGASCRAWRSVTLAHLRLSCCRRIKSFQFPWLLLVRPRIKQPAHPTKKSRRKKCRLASPVPPLCFYNFSSKKSYFFNHPAHLMPDINAGKVKLIGSSNGYLIYNSNIVDIMDETMEEYNYFVKSHFFDDSEKSSSPSSILHLYNPVNGSHFSLPPAPVFDRKMVIVNKIPHSDNVTVAVVCYNGGGYYVNDRCLKTSIAIVRSGDSEWTGLYLSKVKADDFIEDIVFHQERLYVHTINLKMIVYEGINDPSSMSKEAICMKSPAKQASYKVEGYELREEIKAEYHHKAMYYDNIRSRKLVESPDGNVLILFVRWMARSATDSILSVTKVFKHDWSRCNWDLVKRSSDEDLSFLESLDMFFVCRKSQPHLMAHCSSDIDMFTVYDHEGRKRLNIPDTVERALCLWFIPSLY